MIPQATAAPSRLKLVVGFSAGLAIGVLAGLIGLGGAEIRLPVLIALGFDALPAVIVNKTVSLAVVLCALPFRAATVPFSTIAEHWKIIATLLSGSLVGAYVGMRLASRFASRTLFRIICVLMVITALLLFAGDEAIQRHALLAEPWRAMAGVCAGFAIGVVVSMMGVAGGELLVPTLVLLFGIDVKTAGSLSLVISLPTILMGFARIGRDESLAVILAQKTFVLVMVAGSMIGSAIGGLMLGVVPASVLLPLLAATLVLAAIKVWHHASHAG